MKDLHLKLLEATIKLKKNEDWLLEAPGKDCLKLVGDTKTRAAYTHMEILLLSTTNVVELWILRPISQMPACNPSVCSQRRSADSFYFESDLSFACGGNRLHGVVKFRICYY